MLCTDIQWNLAPIMDSPNYGNLADMDMIHWSQITPHIVVTSDSENLPIPICGHVVTPQSSYNITNFTPKADNCMHKQLDEDAQTQEPGKEMPFKPLNVF